MMEHGADPNTIFTKEERGFAWRDYTSLSCIDIIFREMPETADKSVGLYIMIDHGATVYKKTNKKIITAFNRIHRGRNKCRAACVSIVGLRRRIPAVDVNVLKMIGKHVWSTRLKYWNKWEKE